MLSMGWPTILSRKPKADCLHVNRYTDFSLFISGRSAADPFVGPDYPYFTSTNFNFPQFGLEASKSGLSHESPARTVNHTGLPTPSTNSRLSKLHYPQGALLASPFNGPRTSLGLNSGDVGSPYLPPKSRAFVIEGVSSASSQLTVAGFFSVGLGSITRLGLQAYSDKQRRDFESIRGPYLSELKSSGKCVVAFTDLRDTRKALEKTIVTHPEWRATSLSARDCAQELTRTAEGISDYEGQISVKVMIRGHPSDNDISRIANFVQGLVKSFGALSSFKPLYYQTDNTQEYLVEFCDTVDAANAVAALNGASIEVSYPQQALHWTSPADIIALLDCEGLGTWDQTRPPRRRIDLW